jgi:hypothetical protein
MMRPDSRSALNGRRREAAKLNPSVPNFNRRVLSAHWKKCRTLHPAVTKENAAKNATTTILGTCCRLHPTHWRWRVFSSAPVCMTAASSPCDIGVAGGGCGKQRTGPKSMTVWCGPSSIALRKTPFACPLTARRRGHRPGIRSAM